MSNPQATPARDMSGRTDIEALRRTVPVVKDITELAIPGFFETDEEFADFHHMLETSRRASAG